MKTSEANMANKKNIYIGLMTGTSIDAIDAVAVRFLNNSIDLIGTKTYQFQTETVKSIRSLCQLESVSLNQYSELDNDLGKLFAEAVRELMDLHDLQPSQICAIGCHGQTVKHHPNNDKMGFSIQLGNPNILAVETECRVVSDFRRADIALGGQGAPLAPAFHKFCFGSEEENRVIVNIGGIANITFLPKSGHVQGFDTGPGNTLLDLWCRKHINKPFDNEGSWAATGDIDINLLQSFKSEKYFKTKPPKSTGTEEFNLSFIEKHCSDSNSQTVDIQATLTELTAQTIADSISTLPEPVDKVYICGGGCHNTFLVSRLAKSLKQNNIDAPLSTEYLKIDPKWVEASAFAWLAKQRLELKAASIPEVTGAKRSAILGAVYFP